jgi:RNA polymerase sigma-70 factor, ECF subfamily
LGGFDDRRSPRPWLYKIATNVCLDAIRRRPKRVLPIDHGPPAGADEDPGEPLVESVWLEPYPDEKLGVEDGFAAPEARHEQRESVELAFIAALQHLPANQRAVLVLRDVLGFSARETAETLDTTTASVNSALQRARSAVEERLPERSQQATLRSLGDAEIRELVERFIDAWIENDVEALVALLAEDATFAMPPHTTWWRGRETILAFRTRIAPRLPRFRSLEARANGQPAVCWYMRDEDDGGFKAVSLEVLTLEHGGVSEITAFVMPELFGRFGLPDELPAEGSS